MSYNITLPLGMQTSSIDIPSSSDITYNSATRVASLNNIHTYRIADVLQAGSLYDLKPLTLRNNINKWAAFKPNGNSVKGEPYSYHGVYPEGGAMPYDWTYTPPTSGGGYIQESFGGYNHVSPSPGMQDIQSGSVGILERWPVDGMNFLWSDADSVHNIEVIMRLPEFDIRGFLSDDTFHSIDRYWARSYLDGTFSSNVGTIITDSMITNNTIDATYSFTPTMSTLWTGDLGGNSLTPDQNGTKNYSRSFSVEFYLGDIKGDNSPAIYYANFPSNAGGTVSIEGTIQWEYYYVWGLAGIKACLGLGDFTSEFTANRKLTIDRKTGDIINEGQWKWYESGTGLWHIVNGDGTPYEGSIWGISGQGLSGTWEFTNQGIRTSEAIC